MTDTGELGKKFPDATLCVFLFQFKRSRLIHKVDKFLYAGIIYAVPVSNSATVTNPAQLDKILYG
jgi:hypothetical protein